MGRAKRIVIVGAGVIGLCTAYYALERGHEVAIVEAGGQDHDCCSLGNAGMVVPSHFVPLAAPGMVQYGLKMLANPSSPFAVRLYPDKELLRWGWLFGRACTKEHVATSAPLLRDLNVASRRCFERLAERMGDVFGLTKKGLLMLSKSTRALEEEASLARMACDLGVKAQVLTPAEAASLDPGVRMDIAGAVYFPGDCHLTPQLFVARMTEELERLGAEFHYASVVAGWRTRKGRIDAVRTNAYELAGDEFVIAAGAMSAVTMRSLGVTLPLQPGKGYSVTHPSPRQLPAICSILTEARVAVTPMGSSLRFGGTMEIGARAEGVSRRRVEGIFHAIPEYFPEFQEEDFRGLPVWSGLRPCSPDGLPYIGRLNRWANLSVNTGHAMTGVSLGPISGKLMAQMLSGEQPEIDTQALSPDRYDRWG